MTDAIDEMQVGGDHYKTDDPASQHWNVMIKARANYYQGVLTKYIDRYKKKNGIEDLRKSMHYAMKYEGNTYFPAYSEYGAKQLLAPLLERHGEHSLEARAILAVFRNDMATTKELIQAMISTYYPEEPGATYIDPDK